MRAYLVALVLAFLFSSPSAYLLSLKATVSQGTLAVGTNVSVMTGGVELYSAKAGTDGYARFNVSEGSYFIILRRYPYPTQVVLQQVGSDVDRTLSINPVISYSNLFGQVNGPSSFDGTTVSVHSGSTLVKKASADRNGFYMVSFLPEGTYEVTVESPGFEAKKTQLSLPLSQFVQHDAELEAPKPPQVPQYSFSSPSQAEQSSLIEVTLFLGGKPVEGETISASTPSGAVQLRTDSGGKARLNAAEPGAYSFSYANLTTRTLVPSKVQPKPPESAPPEQPPAQPAAQQGGEQGYSVFIIAAAALGMVLVALAVLAFIFKIALGKSSRHKKHEHEHSHEHRKK